MKRILSLLLTALAGAAVGVGTYAAVGGRTHTTTVVREAVAASPASAKTQPLSVNTIYRNASPGVVEIVVRASSGSNFPFGGGGSGETTGQGSGFVYDSSGHIVTNAHVVSGANSVTVKLSNGKTYTAKVVGTDTSSDLAVLSIDAPASELHPLTLADSSTVAVGDGTIAIGSPFGLQNTVTTGIVSGIHRTIDAPDGFAIEDAIQTDAAINHGNSGGPLLDASGDVIGVTSQIESDSGGNVGVGFAIPSNTVKSVASQLLAGHTVKHAFLGVRVATAASGGAVIGSVRASTPAAKAGLHAGDVIVKVGGTAIATGDDLRRAIDAHAPGDKLTLEVRRNGSVRSVTVTLANRPS